MSLNRIVLLSSLFFLFFPTMTPAQEPTKADVKPSRIFTGIFPTKYGIFVRQGEDGKIEFRLHAGGKDKVLYRTDRDQSQIDEVARKLDMLIEEKQADLKARFGIRFSRAGEEVENQLVLADDGTRERGEMIRARAPRLDELVGIEAALNKAAPSHLSADSDKALRFAFLEEPYLDVDGSDVVAYFIKEIPSGGPAVYFHPTGSTGRLATESDFAVFGEMAWENSIEGFTVHELAHNTQHRLGWSDPEVLIENCRSMGWLPFKDHDTDQWMLILQGKHGIYFDYDDSQDIWFAVDQVGQPLDAEGQPAASIQDAQRFSADQVIAQAKVTPPTEYIDNPLEMSADALMQFRLGSTKRANLLKRSPEFYKLAKDLDQADINLSYGLLPSGHPRFIRYTDGQLVEYNNETIAAIAAFETQHVSGAK